MKPARSYRLLCPIARGLDHVGDRWTLLILRDLHAGPARYSDLQKGLTGIAANLLTERLTKLVDDGLAQKIKGPHGAALYDLTEFGRSTRDILFELARFGGHFPDDPAPTAPGNLRTIAVTLSVAASRAATGSEHFTSHLIVDAQDFSMTADAGNVTVTAAIPDAPDLVFETAYAPFLAMAEGELSPDSFARDHVTLTVHNAAAAAPFQTLMAGAIAQLQR
jgi:DNA-binding HxlR family transcriptional regulator